ncbi:MAG: hypothetical protein ACOC16_03255 [Nanoarchaeota archaeon]
MKKNKKIIGIMVFIKKIKLKSIFLCWFLCLLVVFLVNIIWAISFDELIESYDFSYSNGDIDNLSVIDKKLDLNNDSSFDKLFLDIDFLNKKGKYVFYIEFFDINNYSSFVYRVDKNFTFYKNNLKIDVPLKLLNSDQYEVNIKIYKNNILVYRDYDIFTLNLEFDNWNFSKINLNYLGYEFIDKSGLQNQISLKFETEAIIEDKVFYVIISDNDSQLYKEFNLVDYDIDSFNNFSVRLNFSDFKSKKMKNNILVTSIGFYNRTWIYNLEVNDSINLPNNFFVKNIRFNDKIAINKLYFENNFTDKVLEFVLPIEINEIGYYDVELNLYDNSYNLILNENQFLFFDKIGNFNVVFKKNLSYFHKDDFNDVIHIQSIIYDNYKKIKDFNSIKSSILLDINTSSLKSDLYFNEFYVKNDTLFFDIENHGDLDAFGVKIEIFNSNKTVVYQKLIPSILVNKSFKSKVQVVRGENYTGFIDPLNELDEHNEVNNVANYPVIYDLNFDISYDEKSRTLDVIIENIGDHVFNESFEIFNNTVSNINLKSGEYELIKITKNISYDVLYNEKIFFNDFNESFSFMLESKKDVFDEDDKEKSSSSSSLSGSSSSSSSFRVNNNRKGNKSHISNYRELEEDNNKKGYNNFTLNNDIGNNSRIYLKFNLQDKILGLNNLSKLYYLEIIKQNVYLLNFHSQNKSLDETTFKNNFSNIFVVSPMCSFDWNKELKSKIDSTVKLILSDYKDGDNTNITINNKNYNTNNKLLPIEVLTFVYLFCIIY